MEDISRELEREIARIKPAPHKIRKRNHILIVNDFGEMRSGAFLKVLVWLLFVISLAGALGTTVLYGLYSTANNNNVHLENSCHDLEKKIDHLAREKELLMARLVVTGNTAELETLARQGKVGSNPPGKEKRSGMMEKNDKTKTIFSDEKSVPPKVEGTPGRSDDKISPSKQASVGPGGDDPLDQVPDKQGNASVTDFSLTSGARSRELVVRFNIRNTSKSSKGISGRIFCVLKTQGGGPAKWVVIPRASIVDKGIPGPYKKGHYFAISHFKPVKFTVNTSVPLRDFVEASVFILDESQALLTKTTFDIDKDSKMR